MSFGKFDHSEFDAFANQFSAAVKADVAQQIIDKSLKEFSQVVLSEVKERTPFDSGLLRGDWRIAKTSINSYQISNNMHYAPYVEFGHRLSSGGFFPGVFMLQNTLNDLESTFDAIVERNLQKKMKELGL